MSIATEVSRIQSDRNKIRAKLVELGMATNTDKLDTLAASLENMENQGAVSANVKEGETYTIPKGYHNGSGTVSGVSGGGNYTLQSKTATPTKKQQNVTPDAGYYGISDVTVEPIPDAYQDVTSVTSLAADVLTGKVFVDSEGTVTTGTMPNNGTVSKALDTTTTSYTIPKGYHSGTGKVNITTEEKSVEPTEEAQIITPTSGKVISKVVVSAIPSNYADISGVSPNLTADLVLSGMKFVDANGYLATGSMPINNTGNITLDTSTTSYTIPHGFHGGGHKVQIVTEEKSVTPTKSAQTITPTDGKVLTEVSVAPIPANYIDTSDANATEVDIIAGKAAYVGGQLVVGSMPNNGEITATIDGMTTTSYTIPSGATTGGTVSLTTDIEEALAAI